MSNYVPTDLLADILVRLPVESLIRFTSVCKSWYSVITSLSFITKHLNHKKINTESLLLRIYNSGEGKQRYLLCRVEEKKICGEYSERESPFSTPFGYKRIIGSCNGLLCLVDGNSSIILWNPLIRKSLTLPMPSLPLSSSYVFGIGAHPETHEYMLVFIVYEVAHLKQGILPSKVELYTQGTRSWRSITSASAGHPQGIVADDRWHSSFPPFVNGAVHWIAYAFVNREVNLFNYLIMLFHMGSQAFSVMMLPAALVSRSPYRMLIRSYGKSVAVLCYGPPDECCIWVMKEYGVAESWAKLYNINLPGVLRNIVGFRKNGEVMLSTRDRRLLCYDCETETLTNTGYTESADIFTAHSFMESLVLVKPGNGVF